MSKIPSSLPSVSFFLDKGWREPIPMKPALRLKGKEASEGWLEVGDV